MGTALPSLGRTGAAALDALAAAGTRSAASAAAGTRPGSDRNAKARATAVDFEAMFLSNTFNQMFTGIDGDGPFGGSGAVGIWRSFLSQEYAKSFANAGGIGIADHVYRALLAQQEARAP